MDALKAISTRRSAAKLGPPAPTRDQLTVILEAGARAPDHGRLAPWRFVVLEGQGRARLGAAMAALKHRLAPNATPAELAQERAKAERAPVIVVAAARVDTRSKVPGIEQLMAVAAGVQNMWLAAHALGVGAMWKTGAAAYDDGVKEALGLLPGDQIVAFLYLGTTLAGASDRDLDAAAMTTWLDAP